MMIHNARQTLMFALLSTLSACALGAAQWPAVKSIRDTYRVTDPPHAVIKTFVTDAAGQPLYLFICRTAADESVPDVNYAGDLDCRLIEASHGETEENLLVETHASNVAAWYSRGRMFATELHGDCAAYPEYGRLRHFRLRGMKLTMQFDDIRFAPVQASEPVELVSYTLRLAVDPDLSAVRDIAESSGYLDPSVNRPDHPGSCSVVRKGDEWGE